MASLSTAIFYIFIFLTVYVQVFLLITFIENRKKIIIRSGSIKLRNYPAVTLVVPCWNEEGTVDGTVRSLLNLNYPKDKIKIFLIDDGSTDGTWDIINKFSNYPNIKVFRKENGGKYTALNLGLAHVETEFFGGMDSDSFADADSLVRIMSYFEKDPSIMAVAPSLIVHNQKTLVQSAQKMEYLMAVYFKKMLGLLGAIHVTPGPLTIFRKKVFDDLGPYRHAHNTEDMEIAFRMQKHRYKIEHCNDAYVYTGIPKTIRKLFRQRLRWIYGFINNSLDYRELLFRKKYGNFAFFTVPAGILSVFAVTYLLGRIFFNVGEYVYSKIIQYQTIGFDLTASANNFDLFFLNTRSFVLLQILVLALVIFSMILGRKMVEGRWKISLDMLYFFAIFSVVAPFWLVKAVWNTIISKKPAWR